MNAAERRKAQEAAGIPDSKPHIAAEPAQTGETRILACHINGVQVSDLFLGPEVIAALDYYATDEGIAEKNARPNVREASGVSLGRDEFSKALDQRKDDVKDRDMPLYQSRDPLKEVADKFTSPGMRPKFLSAERVKQGGGTGDYEVVKYPEGHPQHGDPVKVKGMVLGQMPEEKAVARNKHYQQKSNQLLKQIGEKYKADGGATAVSDQ